MWQDFHHGSHQEPLAAERLPKLDARDDEIHKQVYSNGYSSGYANSCGSSYQSAYNAYMEDAIKRTAEGIPPDYLHQPPVVEEQLDLSLNKNSVKCEPDSSTGRDF